MQVQVGERRGEEGADARPRKRKVGKEAEGDEHEESDDWYEGRGKLRGTARGRGGRVGRVTVGGPRRIAYTDGL